jgi:hypothetical protein
MPLRPASTRADTAEAETKVNAAKGKVVFSQLSGTFQPSFAY